MPNVKNGNGTAVHRPDFAAIAGWIKSGSSVLDLGCGDGALLRYLKETRRTTGYGVEIDDAGVLACVKNGVSVVQSDLERGLSGFEDGSFDYVVLSQTLQAMKNSEIIIREMLRVGREGIVTFPNFGYWKNRLEVLRGRMPISDNLPFEWFNTPNVRLCTVADFEHFCSERGIRIVDRKVLTNGKAVNVAPNLLGALAVYHFSDAKEVTSTEGVTRLSQKVTAAEEVTGKRL
jgi:methionine biosynthesis protein MetW